MRFPRRRFLQLLVASTAPPAFSRIASAQAYPSRPVRIVVPFTPAGPTDIVARLIGQWLSERLGQQFVIENWPGAGGNVGTEAVVRAPSDGYTLLQAGAFNVINAALYDNLNFSFVRDTVPIVAIVRVPHIMLVHETFPARTVAEFVAYAKANPGKINMASSGIGGTPHVAGELFKMLAGVNMVHVPYRGSAPALTDLLGGQVQVMFDSMPSAIEHVRAGRLRALAVTTAERSDALPGTPTVGEFVPGYEASGWFGLCAPKNTSPEILNRLNKEANEVLDSAKAKARLADLGGRVLGGSPADFGKLIADEAEKWAQVVKFSAARAQQGDRVQRVGALIGFAEDQSHGKALATGFARGLERLGFVEGRNVHVDYRYAAGDSDLYRKYAEELVRLSPDAILASTSPAVEALQSLTRTIPIVFVDVADPIGQGFVQGLARPGGNITGFSTYDAPLMGKWLGLLKQIAPSVAHTAVIFNPTVATFAESFYTAIQAAALRFGIAATLVPVYDDAGIRQAIAAEASQPGGGVVILPDPFTETRLDTIVVAATKHKLPTIGTENFPRAGGLLSYHPGVDVAEQAASYVNRILKGAAPTDLPVQRPTKFILTVNLKTANEIGLTIPETLLATADEVIQ